MTNQTTTKNAEPVRFKIIDTNNVIFTGEANVKEGVAIVLICYEIGLTLPTIVDFNKLPLPTQHACLQDLFQRFQNPGLLPPVELPSDWDDFTLHQTAYVHRITANVAIDSVSNIEEARAKGLLYIQRIATNNKPGTQTEHLVYSNADWSRTISDLRTLIVF